jgi:hypothetical protein
MTEVGCAQVIRVPVDKSLEIDQGLNRSRLKSERVVITYSGRAAVSRRFPVVINLYMNLMHATGVPWEVARAVAGCENVEGRIVV